MINSSVSSNSIDESQSGSSLSEIDPVDEILINAFETPVPKVSLENFALIRVLGRGAYGKVFLVRKIGGHDSGTYYAMKVLKKTRISKKKKTLEHTLAERHVLEKLRGLPFLVNMVYAFHDETKLHIVMEFVRGGELFTHLCRRKYFDSSTAQSILAELVVALGQIHERGVIYRDLKLENILVDEEGHIKLTDFGLSKAFDESLATTDSYCGTIEYMSPEIVSHNSYTNVVDWWSLGVISYELLTGCSPFTVDGDENSTQDIAKRILSKSVPIPNSLDAAAKSLISGLLEKDPLKRLGARGIDEIKGSKFFEEIDWISVEDRQNRPLLKPALSNMLTDLRNFATEFTDLPLIFSPTDCPALELQGIFRGYSFVSPSVMFGNDNVVSSEFCYDNIQILSKTSAFFSKYQIDMNEEGMLGRGTFSICRRCMRLSDGKEFAVKIVSTKFNRHALREIRILELLNPHSFIVHFEESFQDSLHFYIILELLKGGELLNRLRNMERFTEVEAAKIMSQLVQAVSHMHMHDVVHRDLKPENILFENNSPDAKLRLVDFGFARILPANANRDDASLVTPCIGTLHYAAPEVLDIQDELPQYNQQCDLWSLGVILFAMLSGKVPFYARSQTESAADIISRIQSAEFSFDDPVWEKVSDSAKNLINGLLTVDPTKRFSLEQLSNHEWFNVTATANYESETFTELQTPTALPSSADEIFNSTMNAFIVANREGFHLMDVETAPLLVKRRGLKRKSRQDPDGDDMPRQGQKNQKNQSNNKSEAKRPGTLDLLGSDSCSTAFTEYRDTKPPYLRYSRDSRDDFNTLPEGSNN